MLYPLSYERRLLASDQRVCDRWAPSDLPLVAQAAENAASVGDLATLRPLASRGRLLVRSAGLVRDYVADPLVKRDRAVGTGERSKSLLGCGPQVAEDVVGERLEEGAHSL